MKHTVTKPPPGANQPATKAAVAELRRLFARRNAELTWFYEVGEQVELISSLADGRQYGQKVMIWLTNQVQPGLKNLPNLLPLARRFFATYRNRKSEVAKLQRWRDHRRRPLGWTRVAILLSFQDPKVRKEVTEKCLKNRWTAARLREEGRKHRTSKRRGGGFPPTRPKSTVDALKEIGRRCPPLLRWCKHLKLPLTGKTERDIKLSPLAKSKLNLVIEALADLCDVVKKDLKRSSRK